MDSFVRSQVEELMDVNMVRHDEPGYLNEKVAPGDILLSINDQDVLHESVSKLKAMFIGEHIRVRRRRRSK
jgi:hypothetical protein